MGDTAVDIFQETLKELITSSKLSLINKEKHQLQSLEEEIKYLRGFLKDTEKKRDNHPQVMKLVMQIRDLISEAENIVELFVVHAYKADHAPYSLLEHQDDLESVKRRMKTLTAEVNNMSCYLADDKMAGDSIGEALLAYGEYETAEKHLRGVLDHLESAKRRMKTLTAEGNNVSCYLADDEMADDSIGEALPAYGEDETAEEHLSGVLDDEMADDSIRAALWGYGEDETAKEYLSGVLDDSIRAALWGYGEDETTKENLSGVLDDEMADDSIGAALWGYGEDETAEEYLSGVLDDEMADDSIGAALWGYGEDETAEEYLSGVFVHAYKADHAPYSLLEHQDPLESVKMRMKTLMAGVNNMSCYLADDEMADDSIGEALRGYGEDETAEEHLSGVLDSSGGVKGYVVKLLMEEVEKLMEKLDGGEGKPLEIIRIIGSSRRGKITLARAVYNHPSTLNTFEIRVWINVFQNYDKTMKRDLLISILDSTITKKLEDYERHSNDELGEEIFKYLKGRKYLIVINDIWALWGIEAWYDIQKSFPKECKGSKVLFTKVLFTSRLHVQLDGVSYVPHYLASFPNWSWEELQNKGILNVNEKHELQSLEDEMKYLRGFVKHMEKHSDDDHGSLEMEYLERFLKDMGKYSDDWSRKRLVTQFTDLVDEAENIVVQTDHVPYYLLEHQHHLSLDLETVKKGMKTLIAEVKKIYDESMYDINGVATKLLRHSSTENGGVSSSSKRIHTSKIVKENVVVGFDEEVKRLIEKLDDGGQGRSLEIISLIGAGGGGKTTLAKKLYHDPFVKYTFDIRAWIDVSHDYHKARKRDSLISILESISPENSENSSGDKLYENSSDDKLGEDILKLLKGKKYLIVMDDIWGIEAWNDIERSFPKESKGSKVLFTSRHLIPLDGIPWVPYYLDPLPRNRCWELLQKKVFGMEGCPLGLVEIGEKIAEKCKGLPLAIITIAGILATQDKTVDAWENISKNLSSIIAKNQEEVMGILELSYNHLPLHLKACFLYIGGYPEDSEIPIRELIWLWIAEGFIQQSKGEESLETIAEGYLIDLIHRSLVQVARKSPLGGIKACHIHDLLRELCLKKAKDDNFLVNFCEDDSFSPSATNKHRRLFIGHKFFQKFSLRPRNLRSFMYLNLVERYQSMVEKDFSFFDQNFILLRVLNFLSGSCYGEIGRGHLVHLRYLAYEEPDGIRALPFSYLLNLETLNLKSTAKVIELPCDIFKMVKLRHLYTKKGVFNFHRSRREEESIDFDRSSKLDSLQTLHQICACEHCRSFLVRTPNLRKLGLHNGQKKTGDNNIMRFPELECLKFLEKLTFTFQFRYRPFVESTLPPGLKLPSTITRITLKRTCLKWEELSLLQTLPSLEVLKLMESACSGPVWNTSELDGFPQLKYLRFYNLDIMEWIAFEDQFSKLEVLVLECCCKLERIPNDFGYLNDLREIKLERCRSSAEQSAKEIQEEQINRKGDDDCLNLLTINNFF